MEVFLKVKDYLKCKRESRITIYSEQTNHEKEGQYNGMCVIHGFDADVCSDSM